MRNRVKKGAAVLLAILMMGSTGSVWASPAEKEAETQTSPFLQEFQNPSGQNRPKTRWWIPGSHMTKAEIEAEIKSMSDAGFGGAEVVPVSSGGKDGSSIDWGTQQWNEMIRHMLQVAGKYDFTIDFTMTPAWPLALPSIQDLDDPKSGAQMELDGNHVDGITQENPYRGKVPVAKELDAGTPVLMAVTVAKYAEKENAVLDYDSAKTLDLETQVVHNSEDPTDYTVEFTPEEEGEYVLFGWWQHPSGNRTYDNYQVDHFGKGGAQAIIDYWEDNLLPYYGDDFQNASALFIDSLEFQTHLDWTIGLLDDFKQFKNYDFSSYLPAVYDTDSLGNQSANPQPDFQFNRNNDALKNDFRDTLTQLYIENHLKPLSEFCDKHGVQLRYQTSYGKSLELAQTAMYVDIPETETLYSADVIDFYRLQSGAAHMADKQIYSIEASPEGMLHLNFGGHEIHVPQGNGEDSPGNYQQTWDSQIWHVQRAFAGGVNQIVFHGYSYNGQYEGEGNENGYVQGTKWPGFEGFGVDSWSNSWGERLPSWQHARNYTDSIARNQYILRQGEAKVDLAIYEHEYWNVGRSDIYQDDKQLQQQGFTYDFISPSALSLESATVCNGRLNESGPAYKALILNQQQTLTASAATKILSYAQKGFPIVIVGESPSADAFCDNTDVAGMMQELVTYPSVKQVADTDSVPQALRQLGITADASYGEQSCIVNVHRRTNTTDFYYLYNEGNAKNYPAAKEIQPVTTEVTLQGSGTPYFLNAWTGEVTPVSQYTRTANAVTIPVTIAGNDSVTIALTNEDWGQNDLPHVTKGNLNTEYNEHNQLVAKSFESGTETLTLSNQNTVTVTTGQVAQPITLSEWDLSVESWTEGETPTETNKTILQVGTIDGLKLWNKIPGLEKVSGIGRYTTTVFLEQGWEQGSGALIRLGDVVDSYQIEVNGNVVPASQINTTIDIGKYLEAGENTITVEVASTLLNAVLDAHALDGRNPDEYGMMGPVVLTPYRVTKIALQDKQILNTVIAYAEQQLADPAFDQVILSVQQSFRETLKNAQTVADNPAAVQQEVDQAWQALLSEIHKLGFVKGDIRSLKTLVQAAESYDLNQFVEKGQAEFIQALDTAQKLVSEKDNAMEQEIQQTGEKLLNAMLNLRLKADKSLLHSALEDAAGVDISLYTAESVTFFYAAKDAAKAAFDHPNATQMEVDNAVEELQIAICGLKPMVPVSNTDLQGDDNVTASGRNAKTGETAPFAGIVGLTLAGAAAVFLRKCSKQ